MTQTITLTTDFAIRNPFISNSKEVFTDKRQFVNHCLSILGHKEGLQLKIFLPDQAPEYALMYVNADGIERVWCSSKISKQDAWDTAYQEALATIRKYTNRTYSTQSTLENLIATATYPEYKRYWQDLLDVLVAST